MHKIGLKNLNGEHEALLTIGKNLVYLMSKRGIDSTELSTLTGLGTATINSMRRGIGNPTLITIVALAQFFEVSLSEFTDIDIERQEITQKKIKTLPLIKFNGLNAFLDEILDTYDTYTTELCVFENNDCFAININNDSLYPQFSSGTICIVKRDNLPNDGDIVLVKINNSTPCFRRVFIEDAGYFFTAVSIYQDVVPSAYKCFSIVGVIIKIIRNFS
ncbi:XRE family transcriptional regulator [Acerihabitans sp.]|uniref:XRE family transcriptional regulator n=1 Tax=Acerihabitans sp. TaxID=2811394 RepID=UPI002EDB6206